MNVDLLILEDQTDEREVYERIAKRYGLTVVSFESGIEALKYLKEKDNSELPLSYLIDMRTGMSTEELESPLEIFNYLKGKGLIDNFRFHTGHFSEHDKKVQNITNAQIIIKAEPDLEIFLEVLKISKNNKTLL